MIQLLKLEYFKIMAMEDDITHVNKFSDVKIFYEDEAHSFCLVWESFNFSVQTLQHSLQQTIINKLPLDKSFIKPLGYYLTEYYKDHESNLLIYRRSTNANANDVWIGFDYLLFGSSTNIPSSWLYNDHDGNIILEISPIYPWIFNNPKPHEFIIPYEEWMNNYQPYVVKKISRELAEKWIEQITLLINKIEKVETNLCTGPGCKLCAQEGKSGCPCGSRLK